MATYFTSSVRFGDRRAALARGFSSVAMMETAIIMTFEDVASFDTLFCLGGLAVDDEAIARTAALPGRRILLGEDHSGRYEAAGWMVDPVWPAISIARIDDRVVLMSQEPYPENESDDRTMPLDMGAPLLCGPLPGDAYESGRMMSVGFDAWHGPVPETAVIAWMNGLD